MYLYQWYDKGNSTQKKWFDYFWFAAGGFLLISTVISWFADYWLPAVVLLAAFLLWTTSRFFYDANKDSKDVTGNFLACWTLTFLAFLVAGLPTWLIVIVKSMTGATGFWQKLIVYGAGYYFLGLAQLFLGIIFIVLLFGIWRSDKKVTA
jgi:hypothetical protein